MKKVLILLLAVAAVTFAASADKNGDVLLTSPYEVTHGMDKSIVSNGFEIGTKPTTEVMRDIWTGSDFDDDGLKEVILASYGVSGRAYVYEIDSDNNATLFFDTGEMGADLTSSCRDARFGDLDGNGMQELIVSLNSTSTAKRGLWVYEFDTVGDTMRAPVLICNTIGDRWYVENFNVGDVDGDGVQELFVGNNGSASANDNFYIFSVESGTFADKNIVMKTEFTHGKTSATLPIGGSPYGGVMADMDGDGKNEIIFAPWDNGAMLIVEADAADTYTVHNYIETDLDLCDDFAFWDFFPADLDTDGRDELYVSMYDGGRLYAITCPVGTDLSAMTTANVHTLDILASSGGVCTQIGDGDMDGKMDIYASGGGSTITDHEFQGGDPTDAANWIKQTSITSTAFSGVFGMRYAGDLDGDGYPEIYAANTGATTIAAVCIELPAPAVVINEFDTNTSAAEYLELYNPSTIAVDLVAEGYVLVFVNGSGDLIYQATDLTGTIPAQGYYVVAEAGVTTINGYTPDQNAVWTSYQNGPDAVVLIKGGAAANFTNILYTTAYAAQSGVLVDAIIYGGADIELDAAFGTTDINLAVGTTGSTSRVTDGQGEGAPNYANTDWVIQVRTPGITNVLPLEVTDAYSVNGSDIYVKYTGAVPSVDPANYSLKGTAGVTFTGAIIDPVDPSIVTLTAASEIGYDLVLDTLVDATVDGAPVFYAGITPIGWTSMTNPTGHIENAYKALFHGWITANDAYNGVWIHDAEGGEHTGKMIYSSSFDALVAVGDEVSIIAERAEYNNLTELTNPILVSLNNSTPDPYDPFMLDGSDINETIAADTDPAEMWEGQLCVIDSAVVDSFDATGYKYRCSDDGGVTYFWVGDNVDYQLPNVTMAIDEMYNITGVVDYTSSKYRINPRGADDVALTTMPSNNIFEYFTDNTDVANWTSENSGWTVRTYVDTVLMLTDGGWTFDARRPVLATPNTFFKATAKVKTVGSFSANPGAQYLNFGIDGLGSRNYQVSCVSDEGYVTFTVVGYAENAAGTLYIAGQGGAGADTAYVDEYTYEDNYVPGLTAISTVAEARAVGVGEKLATIGVVTTTTEYGTSGPVYIQDGTAGIAVYNYTAAQSVELGDEILAIGTMALYNGLLELSPTLNHIVLSTGNVVEPVEITASMLDGDAYEGQLVMIKGVDTLETGFAWPAAGSNLGLNVKDAEGTSFYLYIDKDTDIDGSPEPTWPMNVIGIIGDYNGAQLLPRSLADFIPNNPPSAFTILNPADDLTVTSLEDPVFVKIPVEADSALALLVNWTKSIDPDEGDTVLYQLFITDGPDEPLITIDTLFYVIVPEDRPWEMNGAHDAYVIAKDAAGAMASSDTIMITFDFPAPPMIDYADVTLDGGTPKVYATFNMPIAKTTVANYSFINMMSGVASAPTAVDSVGPNAVLLSGTLEEDGYVAVAYSGIVAVGGTVSVADTAYAGQVLIPFSANHREDALKVINDFEDGLGTFKQPTYSGSTAGLLAATAFDTSSEVSFRGSKSGKLTLLDNPAIAGGWYVRMLHSYPFSYTVSTTSKLMFMVKGTTTADVEMRLSVKDTGYEQGPWAKVSLVKDDWQVVSFDLANDIAEGWITGNGIVEGATVVIEGIHIKCAEDVDVTLYIDEFTERAIMSMVDVNFKVNMGYWTDLGKFNPASDFVDIAGTMNGWAGSAHLADTYGDTIYDITMAFYPGESMEFKFRINGSWDDATCEFPYGGPNRTFVVPDTNTFYYAWYNDEERPVSIDNLIPMTFALHNNYPNPFNPITHIKYDLPEATDVHLTVFNTLGQRVVDIVNEHQQAGYYEVIWDGRNVRGQIVPSGVYFYRIQTETNVAREKMIFLK